MDKINDTIISVIEAQQLAVKFNAEVCSDLFRAIRHAASNGEYWLKIERHNYHLGEYLRREYGFGFSPTDGTIIW